MQDAMHVQDKASETAKSAVPRLAFSLQETAEALGVSYISVHRLIQRGKLKPVRALRHLLIPRTELDRFLRENLEAA